MSRSVFTHEHHNCGDNMLHLYLVRALAKQYDQIPFVHFCNGCHHANLYEVVVDLSNVLLVPFESDLWKEKQHESIGVWKNEGSAWVDSPLRWDWSSYYLWWHGVVARRMGFESPFTCREHLLFDYPGLEPEFPVAERSFLIGDSAPSSGQYSEWADHSKEPLNQLISLLKNSGFLVTRTSFLKEKGYSITQIGKFSSASQHHIMVPNGPFWPTLSTHNNHWHEGRRRIVLLDNGENLNMPHIEQYRNVAEVMEIAKEAGWV